jgi:hypothetical protein
MARNRIIYASQSVWCNGEVLYRVQSLGSTTTFTSEDIFELGHLDIVDIVDDVPAVAVTLNTNDFGDVRTLAILAQVAPAKKAMAASATNSNANLVVVSGSQLAETSTYLHGVALADFAIVCGNLPGVTIWAPVQDECSLGTLADNIDQSLFLDKVYINSLEFGYTTGANATENYGAETDNKMWLLNAGRFVNYEEFDASAGGTVTLSGVATDAKVVATLSNNTMGFLRKAPNGAPAVTFYDASLNTMTNYEVQATAGLDIFGYNVSGVLTFPSSGAVVPAAGDKLFVVYAASGYASSVNQKYMSIMADKDRPDNVGALRQGQVEIYIVNPSVDTSYDLALRLTSCTITADLTREAMLELGHLAPYDRPLTLPIPITATVEATAGDLENWAKFAGKLTAFDAKTINDLKLADLFGKEDLVLVAKIYAQTDEEARGTGSNRKIGTDSKLIGYSYFNNGVKGTYIAGNTEYPLKTVVVEHLKITDEGMTLDMGANATQTFGFRSTNDLYVVKGDVAIGHVTGAFKIRRNG